MKPSRSVPDVPHPMPREISRRLDSGSTSAAPRSAGRTASQSVPMAEFGVAGIESVSDPVPMPTGMAANVDSALKPKPVESTTQAAVAAMMPESPTTGAPSDEELPVTTATVPVAGIPEKSEEDEQRLAAVNAEMDKALTTKPRASGTTYFDSTGHLAMLTPAASAEANSANPVEKPGTSRRTRSSVRGKDEPGSSDKAMSASTAVDGGLGMGSATGAGIPFGDNGSDEFGTKPEAVLEDVILQQPLENRRVSKVENVLAVTRAKGWPIALIRSDLPDDHWWVQQMVGISGNQFAARVNFGNEESIPGSVYHLVFVFLDSADEVRRFRIAKQFRELPEGTRQSRVFTFMRQ